MQREIENNFNNIWESQIDQSEEEIDLKNLFNIFIEKKKTIAGITLTSFLLGCSFALLQKKLWQGQFQIVLSGSDINSSMNLALPKNNPINKLFNNSSRNNINTELEILKSPYILLPIFEYVMSEKNISDYKVNKFEEWKKDYLEVKFKNNTNILDISYKDNDKDLIIPVLTKISKIYQQYSPNKKIETINTKISYLDDQIDIYKEKYKKSFEKALNFSFEKGLSTNLFSEINPNIIDQNDGVLIKNIEVKLDTLKNLEDSSALIAFSEANLISSEKIKRIKTIISEKEMQLIMYSKVYKDQDVVIKDIKKEILTLSKIFNDELKTFLKSQKEAAINRINAQNSSKEILIEHKKLVSEAIKNQRILINFEDTLRNMQFFLREKTVPWKLITQPLVSENPVAPQKRRIAILWTAAGFAISLFYVLFRYQQIGLLKRNEELQSVLRIPFIDNFNTKEESNLSNFFKFLNKGIISKTNIKKISLVPLGDIENISLNKIENYIQTNDQDKFTLRESLQEIDKDDLIIFITSLKNIFKKDVIKIRNKITLNKLSVFGFLIIDSE
ncbi:Uncharacterized protein involved in exopolysaccharide biosynthesis-like protein [Prochlorococcus marinus str. MIT 9312]|uniref:Uncharacterized protein involved in exopolysaccharide biosynthesis-like protein n=1 Tax=Prochlorococcus marinus (strain MIT 9312) TaxID=74546 RepID=Q319N0_PROM9|nr:Wzz/FepE/Etk N-terminal domain-containing protein [Prochlorococcus marinus]ABB50415.1 Uncharacterized protein involved in exopolysaccharide biosynthesis-like protein [Prochlorococcus marinus str. MIT 9312]KGF99786.1 hypothetical protein EU97_1152 [Prochlorococcus marinus str. MIT 9311]